MKPTVPMQNVPPAGTPPPAGGGGFRGPWTPPPTPGGPPVMPPSETRRSRRGLFLGAGCGCLLVLLAGLGAFGIYVTLVVAARPGPEVASMEIAPGQPFRLSYVEEGRGRRYAAWLEVDVRTEAGYRLSGPITLSADGEPFGRWRVDDTGSGSPTEGRREAIRFEWDETRTRASGEVRLFPLPRRGRGTRIELSGTLSAPAGTEGSLRLYVARR